MNPATAFLVSAILAATAVPRATDPVGIARDQFERGAYQAAIGTLTSALTANPHDARLSYWRARCHLEQANYVQAIADAERAVSDGPDNSEYRRWLGRVYGAAAEDARSFSLARKVRRAFEQAVQLDSSNVAARRDLAEFYLEAPWIVGGDRRKALDQVEAIENVDAVAGLLARAAYAVHEKNTGAAAAGYERVLDLKPGRVDPYLEVADFYEARGDADKFARAVAQAVRVDPADDRLSVLQRSRARARESRPRRCRRLLPRVSEDSAAPPRSSVARVGARMARPSQPAPGKPDRCGR